MELYAKDMFFQGDTEKEQIYDYCIQGKVVFKIEDTYLSDDMDWCVSASAYRFLHTLFENHFMGAEDFLIPCCGHTMIPSEDQKTVTIIGCNDGIDYDVIHEQENIIIKTADHNEYTVSFIDYRNAVLSFANQIQDFYKTKPPREFNDDFDKAGYKAFITEWYSLYDNAVARTNNIPANNVITLDEYDIYTEDEIIGISKDGISLRTFAFINFRECAYNFMITIGGSGKCIGDRDITDLSFTFYTSPKPIKIKFIKKNKFIELFKKKNTFSRFHKLQMQITNYGYSTYDMS